MTRRLPIIVLVGIALGGATAPLAATGASGHATSSGPVLLTATLESDGSLVRSRSTGAVSVSHPTTGRYRVTFNRSLARCAVATASLAGNTSTNTYGWQHRIMAATSGSNLYLTLQGKDDAPADFASSAVLACSSAVTGVGANPPVLPGAAPGVITAAMPIMYATISSKGTLERTRSLGATSVLPSGGAFGGKYRITFNRSVARCAVTAASLAGDTTRTTFGWDNRIMLTTSGKYVYATLQGKNDGPSDYPFSVILACASPGMNATRMPIMYASVSSTGTLESTRSRGATSVVHPSGGKYRITFNRSVARCAVSVASLAGSSAYVFGWDNRIMLTTSGQNVYATLQGKNDGPSDYAFSVILACSSLPKVAAPVAEPDWTVPVP